MNECKDCRFLLFDPPCKDGDCYSVHCTDPDKPVMGACRTLAVGWVGYPTNILRPAWCRGKEKV